MASDEGMVNIRVLHRLGFEPGAETDKHSMTVASGSPPLQWVGGSQTP